MRLPFFSDTSELLNRVAQLGGACALDSADSDSGRWDIVAAAPAQTLALHADATDAELDSFVAAVLALEASLPPVDGGGLPFSGGLIGFFSYELGRRLQGLAPSPGCVQPLAVVHHYRWAIVQDRRAQRSALVGSEGDAPGADRLQALLSNTAPAPPTVPQLAGPFQGPWDIDAYRSRFRRVMDYIHAGDCYQMNLGQPFQAAYRGELRGAYALLRTLARAPFSAFFPLSGTGELLSLSPERFLTVNGDRVDTHPIKGTRPRDADPVRDRALAEELAASEKERAENLMIVDLLRNDISRFCTTGSVTVRQLFDLESYSTVHHLVSHVRGQLRSDVSPLQLLLGCMPGGSITGAPKHRAMQLIDELEPAPRESWCGSLFLRSACGRMDSNILIRTLHGDGRKLTCWAGGGLVADSRAEDEFAELGHKVGAFLHALGGTG